MGTIYRCAVVGLGNIGFRFSRDSRREGTWSHVDAYARSGRTALSGAVEVDKAAAEEFSAAHPDVPVYPTVGELFGEQEIDIVSIAVPTPYHFPVFSDVAKYPVRAIFCEKPLSDSPGRSRQMVRITGERGITLALNYTRRWDRAYLMARQMVADGKIGVLKTVNAYYSGHIFTMGSHLLDTVHMLADPEPATVSGVFVREGADPSVSGWIRCNDGMFITYSATGKREDMIFEIDLIGDEGRLTVAGNGAEVTLAPFRESRRFTGYREPAKGRPVIPPKGDRFVNAVRDIAEVLDGTKAAPRCTGSDGLWVDVLIGAALRSAGRGGIPVDVGGILP